MTIVVIGGTGLIGSKAVSDRRQKGQAATRAAPSTGAQIVAGIGRQKMGDHGRV